MTYPYFHARFELLPGRHFNPTGGLEASYYRCPDVTRDVQDGEQLLIRKYHEQTGR